MRFKLLFAGVIGLVTFAASHAQAQASSGQAQTSAPRVGNARETDAPPTLEQMQRAVSRLRGGRIERPRSYDALTPEQKSYVQGILSGPRGDISGSRRGAATPASYDAGDPAVACRRGLQ